MAASLLALAACSSMLRPERHGHPDRRAATRRPCPIGTDPEDEAIGAREHPRIVASYGGVYEDRQAEIMLARIVGRLLAAADQPNTQFTVTILDSSEVNAFALPGGYVYVTRGILALASDTQRARGGAGARDRARDAEACARPHQPGADHRDRRHGGDRRLRRRRRDRPDLQPLAAVARGVQPAAGARRPTRKASGSPARRGTIRMRRRASSAP